MQWYELSFLVSEEASEALAEQLIRFGSWGLATEDPFELKRMIEDENTTVFVDADFLEGLPDYVRVKAFFPLREEGIQLVPMLTEEENPFAVIEQRLYQATDVDFCSLDELHVEAGKMLEHLGQFLPLGPGEFAIRPIQEEDWANSWKMYYQPIEISERLLICPSWIEAEAKEDQLVLYMDPGSAFGTGSHETTSLCLRLLDNYVDSVDKILDLGCGSGILAIAAAKCTGRRVDAVDIDPGAVHVTKDNAHKNTCSELIRAAVGGLDKRFEHTYDLIIANLLAEVLVSLEEQLRVAVCSGGLLVCSGIVSHKLPLIEAAFTVENWDVIETKIENDWVARVYRKK